MVDIKANPSKINDIFSELVEPYADRKYGLDELQRIKDYLATHEIAVTHSFHEGVAKVPSFSIQLGTDGDQANKDAIDDHLEEERETIVNQAELDALKKIDNFTPTAYDSVSGMVSVNNSDDISTVRAGNIYEDGAGTEHTIRSGISDVAGNKFFFIAKNIVVDLNPGLIRSFITEKQFEIKVVPNQTSIMVGIHNKEALLTKYFYVLLKYFLQSRKKDLITRGFDNPILSGSDFTRDLEYQGDMVFTRFLTISGRTEDTWRSEETTIIDEIEIEGTLESQAKDR